MLIVGTVVLLLVSGGIVIWGSRSQPAPPPPLTSPNISAGTAATPQPPTATATQPPTPSPTQTMTPTARPTQNSAATVTAAIPRPSSTATRAAASATPSRPLVANGPCAVALPSGFGEERSGGGYYPATDQTGFAALDQFNTEGGARGAEALARGFVTANLTRVLQNVRQTGAEQTADGGYRIDFTASVGGQPGRGSVYVRAFDTVACGTTLFLLDRSPLPFATTREVMILSLQKR